MENQLLNYQTGSVGVVQRSARMDELSGPFTKRFVRSTLNFLAKENDNFNFKIKLFTIHISET